MSRKSVVGAKVLELITVGDSGGGVSVATLLHQVYVQDWSRDRLMNALGRLLRRGRVKRVLRGKKWYYSVPAPRMAEARKSKKKAVENKTEARLDKEVLRFFFARSPVDEPCKVDTIGPELAVVPGMAPITTDTVRAACERLTANGYLRCDLAAGTYALDVCVASLPGMLRDGDVEKVVRARLAEFHAACLTALHPDGAGAQLAPVTIPAQIAQLRADLEAANRYLGTELEMRHKAEHQAAVLREALEHTKGVHTEEIAHLNKLLENERKASAALVKRVEAVQLLVQLALG